ncbi:MAG: ABC transporter substrate-binding protein [Pseudomonadota bacterium]
MSNIKNEKILADLIAASKAKRVNRRGFMEGALYTGAGAAAASTMWATKVEAQTPKRGGNFRVGVHDGNTSDGFDPGTYNSVLQIQLAHAAFSWLTEITNENGLGPDLATEWSATPDATTWTFALNPSATFHDGTPVTATDVIASMNHHRGEASTSAAKAILNIVDDITADGDHTVVFTLSTGVADLPYLLTDYHLCIFKAKADGTIDWQSGIGCGPYAINSHDPGIRTELTRHEGWHRIEEGAFFDSVTMITLNDANARQTALITNQVDAITSVDLKTVSMLGRAPGILIDNVPSGSHVTIPGFADTAPFDNVDARLALKYAINRQDIVDKIFFGNASVGNDTPLNETFPFFEPAAQRPYDPDRAKFHLDKAGMSSMDIDIHASDSVFSGAVDMVSLIAEHARPAGINVTTKREPADNFWANVWLKQPFPVVQWGARPTPDAIFSLVYQGGVAWNEGRWANDRFDELLFAAKAELDGERRTEMYTEMSTILQDESPVVIPLFVNRIGGRRDNVMHAEQIASNWELDGARGYQRWWFA